MVDRARRLGRWFLALIPAGDPGVLRVVMPMISLRSAGPAWLGCRWWTGAGPVSPDPAGLGVFGGSLCRQVRAAPLIVCGMLLRALALPARPMPRAGLELILPHHLGLGGCLFDPPAPPW